MYKFIVFLFFISCKNKIKIVKEPTYFIKANFINDSTVDGTAEYYNLNNVLFNRTQFTNGIKNGYSVNYFENQKIKDSTLFVNNNKDGFSYFFNNHGHLTRKEFYFHGISVGPTLIYENTLFKKYIFTDFAGNNICSIIYDSITTKHKLINFSTSPHFWINNYDGELSFSLFFYTPQPPNTNIEYFLGLTSKEKKDSILKKISPNKFFIDTIIPYPQEGYNYFIQSKVKSEFINKVIIEDCKVLPD